MGDDMTPAEQIAIAADAAALTQAEAALALDRGGTSRQAGDDTWTPRMALSFLDARKTRLLRCGDGQRGLSLGART